MTFEMRDRDATWLESVYRAHHDAVLAYAVRRVREDEADDIVAATFLTAWQKRQFVPEAALPWLYRTAAHHIQHARRGEARRGRLTARGELRPARRDDHSPYDGVDAALDAQSSVHAMLARLPERDAEVLRLAAWENLEVSEIADVLGVSVPTARVRLHRARRRGEAILDRLAQPPPDRTCPTSTSSAARTDDARSDHTDRRPPQTRPDARAATHPTHVLSTRPEAIR